MEQKICRDYQQIAPASQCGANTALTDVKSKMNSASSPKGLNTFWAWWSGGDCTSRLIIGWPEFNSQTIRCKICVPTDKSTRYMPANFVFTLLLQSKIEFPHMFFTNSWWRKCVLWNHGTKIVIHLIKKEEEEFSSLTSPMLFQSKTFSPVGSNREKRIQTKRNKTLVREIPSVLHLSKVNSCDIKVLMTLTPKNLPLCQTLRWDAGWLAMFCFCHFWKTKEPTCSGNKNKMNFSVVQGSHLFDNKNRITCAVNAVLYTIKNCWPI